MGCYPPGCSPCDRLYRCPSHIPWVIVAKAEVYLLSFLAYFLVQVTITPPGCSTCDRSYRCSHTLAVLDCLELVSYTLVPCRDDLSWLHIYEASSDWLHSVALSSMTGGTFRTCTKVSTEHVTEHIRYQTKRWEWHRTSWKSRLFTPDSIISISTHCAGLPSLNLWGCRNITDASN